MPPSPKKQKNKSHKHDQKGHMSGLKRIDRRPKKNNVAMLRYALFMRELCMHSSQSNFYAALT